MLDLSCVGKRYFPVRFMGRQLDLEPPKLKTISKILDAIKTAQKDDPDGGIELFRQVARLLSKNKQHYRVTLEMVENNLTFDAMMSLLTEFFGWLNKEKNDPN